MMITETYPAELIRIARKNVSYDAPDQTLQDVKTFLSHLMVYGSPTDLAVVERYVPQMNFGRCWKTCRQESSLRKPGRLGMSAWEVPPFRLSAGAALPDGTLGPEPGTFFGKC